MSAEPDSKLAWIDAYLAQLRDQRQLSPHTVAAYARDLQELAELSAGQDWPQLDHFAIRRLTAKLHSRQLDPRSIARKLSSWRGFFEWLSGQITLSSNPVQGVRPSRPRRCRARCRSTTPCGWWRRPRLTPAPPPKRPGCATAPCSNCCIPAACGYPSWPDWT
jgi:integrase/recombinase XerC